MVDQCTQQYTWAANCLCERITVGRICLTDDLKEVCLQDDQMTQLATTSPHQGINRALHAIASHLHRYTSKLSSIEDTANAIVKHHHTIRPPAANFERLTDGFHQVASQLKAAKDFELELEKKTQNSLALVIHSKGDLSKLLSWQDYELLNRIQLGNDRVLVADGIAMQEIWKATQEETKISQDLALKTHKLSESMKKDSLSMKTVHWLSQHIANWG